MTGLLMGVGHANDAWKDPQFYGNCGLDSFHLSISSYLAMNFTGSTPYTSPSGVEKEMRVAIPFQGVAITLAVVGWVGSAFI